MGDPGSIPGLGRSPGEGNGNPLQYFFPGEFHGQRSLVGCSPWGCKELDTTERLHFYFSLFCIGEGKGYPLQYCGLENSVDCIVHGVAKSQTQLNDFHSIFTSLPQETMEMEVLEWLGHVNKESDSAEENNLH